MQFEPNYDWIQTLIINEKFGKFKNIIDISWTYKILEITATANRILVYRFEHVKKRSQRPI